MKVSVSIVAYEQASTIRQAVESAASQLTTFPFEIIAGDDASTDGTATILRDLEASATVPLRAILRADNPGDFGLSNVMATIAAARGTYVAFLDGDDYWTDPGKLQRQIEVLDAHPDAMICAHRVTHLAADGTRTLSPRPPRGTGLYDVGDLILRNFAPKISTVIRKSALDTLPDWYRTSRVASADWVLNVLSSRHGRVAFIDDVMAVHRLHGASVSAIYGAERMFEDKLRILSALRGEIPQADRQLTILDRKLRWKLRAARLSPRLFTLLRSLNGTLRSRTN